MQLSVFLIYFECFPSYSWPFCSGVVECGRRPTDPITLAALAAAEQRRQQLHSTREDRQAVEDLQHLAQHLEQQSQPGNATQQAQEAAAQPEVVALINRMELRSSAAAQVTQLQTRV